MLIIGVKIPINVSRQLNALGAVVNDVIIPSNALSRLLKNVPSVGCQTGFDFCSKSSFNKLLNGSIVVIRKVHLNGLKSIWLTNERSVILYFLLTRTLNDSYCIERYYHY